jgi:hypothetical protein
MYSELESEREGGQALSSAAFKAKPAIARLEIPND